MNTLHPNRCPYVDDSDEAVTASVAQPTIISSSHIALQVDMLDAEDV